MFKKKFFNFAISTLMIASMTGNAFAAESCEEIEARINNLQTRIDGIESMISAHTGFEHETGITFFTFAGKSLRIAKEKRADLLKKYHSQVKESKSQEFEFVETYSQDLYQEPSDWSGETPAVDTSTLEYPTATCIWDFLRSTGYDDSVCAGIMGNIMAEVGGDTLDIQYYLESYTGGFFGMCQWSEEYYPEIYGASLEEQCYFLLNNIEEEINMFGDSYCSNFTYSDFINLTDAGEAAKAFAQCYERCGSVSCDQRMENAWVALNYFQ